MCHAIVVMFRGMPAKPDTVSFSLKLSGTVLASSTCTGSRPVWKLQRDGEQLLKAKWWESSMPERARRSMFGVATSGDGGSPAAARW